MMTPDLAKDLRNWLVEPDHMCKQRNHPPLSAKQMDFATSRTDSGYRRIKGPAGSGKSQALASRAAVLADAGHEVLIVAFNITLRNYLRDLTRRWPVSSPEAWGRIRCLHFHYWCKDVCRRADKMPLYKAVWSDASGGSGDSDESVPPALLALVGEILDQGTDCPRQMYGAVLVDEGQDFEPAWWNVLRKACESDGEMILAADQTQDVYQKGGAWTEHAMTGAGFRGDWSRLEISYRLPLIMIPHLRLVAEVHMDGVEVDLPDAVEMDLPLATCSMRWVQVDAASVVDVCADEVSQIVAHFDPHAVAIADTTFLAGSIAVGLAMVSTLEAAGLAVTHTFDQDEYAARQLKVGFGMGAGCIKATTIHSFKGWETGSLVLNIPGGADRKAMAAVYTGLTRLKAHPVRSHVTVVCAEQALFEYGTTWPSFVDLTAGDREHATAPA